MLFTYLKKNQLDTKIAHYIISDECLTHSVAVEPKDCVGVLGILQNVVHGMHTVQIRVTLQRIKIRINKKFRINKNSY